MIYRKNWDTCLNITAMLIYVTCEPSTSFCVKAFHTFNMQIKTVLLLVVIGAVAVLAKKGSSEEDRNGYANFQVWPAGRPGHGPKPFKFKGPKHQVFVVGRPQYMQPSIYPQYPQYAQQPGYQVQQQGISPLEVQQYLEGIDRQMQEASANAYREFQRIESIIDGRRRNLEETMKKQFQTLEVALEAKQAKEIQEAVKDGKDELKIQECLAREEEEARAEMDADIQRTKDCLNDATERARRALNNARNVYTETSFMTSLQAKEWAQKMRSCAEIGRNNQCVEEGMNLINEATKRTVEEGNQHMRNMQEPLQQQTIQMQYCSENFGDDLKDMKNMYSKMVKRCVVAAEIGESEENSEDDEESKSNENVQVKPEIEAQVEAKVEA